MIEIWIWSIIGVLVVLIISISVLQFIEKRKQRKEDKKPFNSKSKIEDSGFLRTRIPDDEDFEVISHGTKDNPMVKLRQK